MAKLSLAKLERYAYGAADILRREGMDAATYKDFIFGLLFLRRCSDEVRLGRQRSPAHDIGQHMKPYLQVASVFDGFVDYSDILAMNFEPAEQETYGLIPGDTPLNEGQSLELVGRSEIFSGPAGVYFFQNTLVRFRCNSTTIPVFCQAMFKYWLDTRRFTLIVKQTASVAHLGAVIALRRCPSQGPHCRSKAESRRISTRTVNTWSVRRPTWQNCGC